MPTLPGHPNLDQLRRQAKELVRAARKGDAGALERIGSASGKVTLAAGQLAIAREYGSGCCSTPARTRGATAKVTAEELACSRKRLPREPRRG
jgi:hypothetical protein